MRTSGLASVNPSHNGTSSCTLPRSEGGSVGGSVARRWGHGGDGPGGRWGPRLGGWGARPNTARPDRVFGWGILDQKNVWLLCTSGDVRD